MKVRITIAVLFLAFLAVTGVVFEQIERKRERSRFPQVGRSVNIGGRSLNLFCSGEGNPAAIPLHLGFPPDLLIRAVSSVGLMRLTVHGNGRNFTAQGFTPGEQATLTGLQSQPKVRAAFLAEQGFASGPDEVRAAGNLGDLPVIVLASDASPENARQIARNEVKVQMQQQLAQLSTRGRLEPVKDSEGPIQFEAPGAIVRAVRDVLQAIP
jgi:hypothetical protein